MKEVTMDLVPVSEWEDNFKHPTEHALRKMIRQADELGLIEAGVVLKVNGRLLIDKTAFDQWCLDNNELASDDGKGAKNV
jgi:hypothetical protein